MCGQGHDSLNCLSIIHNSHITIGSISSVVATNLYNRRPDEGAKSKAPAPPTQGFGS